jgi:hypothetical protein
LLIEQVETLDEPFEDPLLLFLVLKVSKPYSARWPRLRRRVGEHPAAVLDFYVKPIALKKDPVFVPTA